MSANPSPTSHPAIPQRPAHSPANGSPAPPTVPVRPKSRVERSKSPAMVNAYAQSPLNQRPESPSKPSPILQPTQPPTVKIPSVGQEGVEYADYERLKAEAKNELEEEQQQQQRSSSPSQTRSVASDLKLHYPRPSAGSTTAKVSNITRSGLDGSSRPSLSSRPNSLISPDSESGSSDKPVEPGTRVPMYPGAGEVQAPTPRSDSTKPKASGEFPRPPDSYGLHSHHVEPTSRLEKEWYQKHPEAQKREGKISKAMHGARPEDAYSSDALNKLVRDTARKNEPRSEPGNMGTPDEEIAYRATDQLVSRLHLSRPNSRPASVHSPSHPSPEKEDQLDDIEGVTVHIDAPEADPHAIEPEQQESVHKAYRSPGPGAQRTTSIDSPVLAADEMDKGHHLPAAIPPLEWKAHSRASSTNGRPKSSNHKNTSSSDITSSSSSKKSPTSAPQALQSPPEAQEEQKPLFSGEPEDGKARLERFKTRPDLAEHRFPSKDVWEDSPDSSYLETVIDAPEPVPEGIDESSELNNPQASTLRLSEGEKKEPAPSTESQLHADAAKELGGNKPRLDRASSSYYSQQHFPSKDIWEDAPDSAYLEATIQETDEKADESPTSAITSPIDPPAKPAIPTRPTRPAKRSARSSEENKEAKATTPAAQPAEPSPSETKRQPPVIPGRPKPQIPARPARRPKSPVKQGSQDSGLSRTISGTSTTSIGSGNGTDTTAKGAPPAVPKSKPAISARPVGSKIAALQAGFLSDLNNRLKIGPQGPPPKPQPKHEEEAEEEKAPLSDARKGRAKGPARRKPAAKPVAAAVEGPKFEIVKAWSIFDIEPNGILTVNSQSSAEGLEAGRKQKDEKKEAVEEPAKALLVPAETQPIEEMDSAITVKSIAATSANKEEVVPDVTQESDAAEPQGEPTDIISEKPTDASVEPAFEPKEEVHSPEKETEASEPEPAAQPKEKDEPIAASVDHSPAQESPSKKSAAVAAASTSEAEEKSESEQP
ncbi:Serine/threonine-protein phosphatase 2A activator 1 [Ascosphaera pollenicola]|nr:Serine/threonine-protein phosphatase 2A activator 1 [Ascosphaera pollenicola]